MDSAAPRCTRLFMPGPEEDPLYAQNRSGLASDPRSVGLSQLCEPFAGFPLRGGSAEGGGEVSPLQAAFFISPASAFHLIHRKRSPFPSKGKAFGDLRRA